MSHYGTCSVTIPPENRVLGGRYVLLCSSGPLIISQPSYGVGLVLLGSISSPCNPGSRYRVPGVVSHRWPGLAVAIIYRGNEECLNTEAFHLSLKKLWEVHMVVEVHGNHKPLLRWENSVYSTDNKLPRSITETLHEMESGKIKYTATWGWM